MGIRPVDAFVLGRLAERIQRKERLLMLGRQAFFMTPQQWRQGAAKLRISLRPFRDMTDQNGMLTSVGFFQSLGFTNIEALDVSDYEQAEHLHDMNCDDLPDHLVGAFDVIFDGGTIEHVFHIPNFLKNVCRLTRQQGCVVHSNPSNGLLDHGFYQISPTLFADWYSANHFSIVSANLIYDSLTGGYLSEGYSGDEYHNPQNAQTWRSWDRTSVMFCAQKTQESTWNAIPMQGVYSRMFNDPQATADLGRAICLSSEDLRSRRRPWWKKIWQDKHNKAA